MFRIVYSKLARVDIDTLSEQIADRDGERRAYDIIDRIFNRISYLKSHPEMGSARPNIQPSARVLVSDRWLILYEIKGDVVQVVRVVDGAADLNTLSWDFLK